MMPHFHKRGVIEMSAEHGKKSIADLVAAKQAIDYAERFANALGSSLSKSRKRHVLLSRESHGFVAYIKAVMFLHAIRRECRRRGIDIDIVPVSAFTAVDLTNMGGRLRSICEAPVSVN